MWLLAYLSKWRRENDSEQETSFSVDNCGLTKDQIHLASFTIEALGLRRGSALSLEDLVFLCYSVGLNPPEYVIEAKLRGLGLVRQSEYGFEHFLHLWRALLENQDEEEAILERAFNFFDRDGNGEISTTEFKTAMRELGNLLSDAEMDEFLTVMDTNKDGAIDYGEFIRLLKCQRPIFPEFSSTRRASRASTEIEIPSYPGRNETYLPEIPDSMSSPSKDLSIDGAHEEGETVKMDAEEEAAEIVDGLYADDLEASP